MPDYVQFLTNIITCKLQTMYVWFRIIKCDKNFMNNEIIIICNINILWEPLELRLSAVTSEFWIVRLSVCFIPSRYAFNLSNFLIFKCITMSLFYVHRGLDFPSIVSIGLLKSLLIIQITVEVAGRNYRSFEKKTKMIQGITRLKFYKVMALPALLYGLSLIHI